MQAFEQPKPNCSTPKTQTAFKRKSQMKEFELKKAPPLEVPKFEKFSSELRMAPISEFPENEF